MNTLSDPPELSPLEQEVLEEYELLAENMKKVSPFLLFSPRLLPSHPPIPELALPSPYAQWIAILGRQDEGVG